MAHSEAERGKVTDTPVGCACGEGVLDWKRIIGIVKQQPEVAFQLRLSFRAALFEAVHQKQHGLQFRRCSAKGGRGISMAR